jgi:hypothetical protein
MMIKVGLSTRNRYVISEMGAIAMGPVTDRPLCEVRSSAVQAPSDWLRPLDRGLRCTRCGAEAGGGVAETDLAASAARSRELAAA